MIDDMPFLSGDRGTVEWDMIPMENISQIEVIKGASSALFGSSAIKRSDNIRTEYPTNKPKTEVSIFQGFYDKAKRESLNWWGTIHNILVVFHLVMQNIKIILVLFLEEIYLMTLDIKKGLKTEEEDLILVQKKTGKIKRFLTRFKWKFHV